MPYFLKDSLLLYLPGKVLLLKPSIVQMDRELTGRPWLDPWGGGKEAGGSIVRQVDEGLQVGWRRL